VTHDPHDPSKMVTHLTHDPWPTGPFPPLPAGVRDYCPGKFLSYNIGADSMDRYGQSRQWPKICGGDAPNRRTGMLLRQFFWNTKMSKFLNIGVCSNPFAIKLNKLYFANTAKMFSKYYECVIAQVTKGALISPWTCIKSIWSSGGFGDRAPPGPDGELTALPKRSSWI